MRTRRSFTLRIAGFAELVRGRRLHFGLQGLQQLPAAPGPSRIVIPVVRSWWRRLFPKREQPAVKSLARRGHLAPLTLRIDDEVINIDKWGTVSREGGGKVGFTVTGSMGANTTVLGDEDRGPTVASDHHLLEVRWGAGKEQTALAIPAHSQAGLKIGKSVSAFSDKFPRRCWAAAAVRAGRYSRTEIVQYGVTLRFKTPLPFHEIPNLWLLVPDDRMPTGLSFLQSRYDEAAEHRLLDLAADLKRIFLETAEPGHSSWLLRLFELRSQKTGANNSLSSRLNSPPRV